MRTLIKGGTIVNANAMAPADVLVEGEEIALIGRDLDVPADRVIDATGKWVIPGGIDPHTHMELPFGGTFAKDTFETGTRAAAFGGTTTIVDFAVQTRGRSLREGLDAWPPSASALNRMHAEDPQRYPRTAAEGYFMDPAEMMRLERSLAAQGRAVKVIVHSHVDVGAYFSQEDKTRALWAGEPLLPGIVYLVCGVQARQPDGAILDWFDEATRDFTTAPLEA